MADSVSKGKFSEQNKESCEEKEGSDKKTIEKIIKRLADDVQTSERISELKQEFSDRKYLIGIAGNIGVGKSTLTEILSALLECPPYEELNSPNPYLEKFYEEPKKWAYKSQLFFLNEKAKKMREICQKRKSAIIDRTIYEDINVFGRTQKEFGYMNPLEWAAYKVRSFLYTMRLPYPDVIIYLRGNPRPTLLERINERKRPEETQDNSRLDVEYLHLLNGLYELMIYSIKKNRKTKICIIDTDYTKQEIISQRPKEEVIERVARESIDFLYKSFCRRDLK